MLRLVVVLSETSGLIQIILPSDVTFFAWLTKAGDLVREPFPGVTGKGNFSFRDCVSRILDTLGQK